MPTVFLFNITIYITTTTSIRKRHNLIYYTHKKRTVEIAYFIFAPVENRRDLHPK